MIQQPAALLSPVSIEPASGMSAIDTWCLPTHASGNIMAYFPTNLAPASSCTSDGSSGGATPQLQRQSSGGSNGVGGCLGDVMINNANIHNNNNNNNIHIINTNNNNNNNNNSNNLHHTNKKASTYGRNIYVASLPEDINDEKLRALFAPFGEIISAKAMPCKDTDRCRGYGFVLFERQEDAARAQAEMIGCVVGGNKIQVRQARPSACRQISNENETPPPPPVHHRPTINLQLPPHTTTAPTTTVTSPLSFFHMPASNNNNNNNNINHNLSFIAPDMPQSTYLAPPLTPQGPFIINSPQHHNPQHQPVVYMMVPVTASGGFDTAGYHRTL